MYWILFAYDEEKLTGGADHARGVYPNPKAAMAAGEKLLSDAGPFQHVYIAEPVDLDRGHLDLVPTLIWIEKTHSWRDVLPGRVPL